MAQIRKLLLRQIFILSVKLYIIAVLGCKRMFPDIIPVIALYSTADFPAVNCCHVNQTVFKIAVEKCRKHKSCRCISFLFRNILPHDTSAADIRHQDKVRKNLFHDYNIIDFIFRVIIHLLSVEQ